MNKEKVFKEKEETLAEYIELITKYTPQGAFMNENIELVDRLLTKTKELAHKYSEHFNQVEVEERIAQGKVYTIEERLKIAKDFYKTLGIDIDIDKMIQNGQIEMSGVYYEESFLEAPYSSLGGSYHRSIGRQNDSDFSYIEINQTGHLADASSIVHELAHFLDFEDKEQRRNIDDILAETKAVLFQLLFIDYIKEAYPEEAKDMLKIRLIYLYKEAEQLSKYYPLLYLQSRYGEVNSLASTYNNKNEKEYEELINTCQDVYNSGLTKYFGYVLALYMAPLLKKELLKDKSRIKEVLERPNTKNIYFDTFAKIRTFDKEIRDIYDNKNRVIIDENGYRLMDEALEELIEEVITKEPSKTA